MYALQHSNTRPQVSVRNIGEQLMAKPRRGRVDLGDHPMRPPAKVDRFAAAIVRRVSAREPAVSFQAMQKRDKRRLLNPEPLRDLGLSERTRCD
jgi:hypothetical protein